MEIDSKFNYRIINFTCIFIRWRQVFSFKKKSTALGGCLINVKNLIIIRVPIGVCFRTVESLVNEMNYETASKRGGFFLGISGKRKMRR
jgi:hypothetical protein